MLRNKSRIFTENCYFYAIVSCISKLIHSDIKGYLGVHRLASASPLVFRHPACCGDERQNKSFQCGEQKLVPRWKARDKFYILCLITIILIFSVLCCAEDIQNLKEFVKDDKILILAPHPDDEVIATGGVIQEALKKDAKVKVICLTNGEHNEFAFIIYEKRITFRSKGFIHLGEIRRNESIEGMKMLGLGENDLISLGYPDYGTMEILTKYWGDTKPFKYLLTRIKKVPYPECLTPNAPYVGESILRDLEKVILDFKPTKIFVSNPVDVNRDHCALYLFVQIALLDLEDKIQRPEIFPYLVHTVGWPLPRGYHPDLELAPPGDLVNKGITWSKLELSDEEIKKKYLAISCHKSQVKSSSQYLFTFARKNELFGTYPVIKLKEGKELEWHDVNITTPANRVPHLSYAQKDKNLLIRIKLKKKFHKQMGITVSLLGYSKNKDFSVMPKIQIRIGFRGLKLMDKRKTLPAKNIQMESKNKILTLKIPFNILENPDYILAYVKTSAKDLNASETAWRILDCIGN